MKRIAYLFFAVCLIGAIPLTGAAQEQSETEYGETYAPADNKAPAIEIPPGMELRKVGSIKMIVPKGTQVRKKGSLVIMEGPDEYAARNIYEMNSRLMAMEARQLSVERELEGLRQAMLRLQERSASADNGRTP